MTVELARVVDLGWAHLSLSLWALLLGAAISVPLGIAASRRPWLERAVLGAASVVQTIPGLALLAVMVPALAAIGTLGVEVPSIGALPAVIGLTLYSLLPMLRNTVVGLREVDPAVKEAALGVGMTPAQSLRLVELPLAAPMIVAGLRTATVWTVGMATLATPVGASSLGDLIFSGLQTRDHGAVIAGCAAAAFLAIALDVLIRAVERGVRARRRIAWAIPAAILGAACLGALTMPLAGLFADSGASPVRIGAKPFTEQYVLAEILRERAARTGRPTRVLRSLGSSVAFDALAAGDLDVYVEYTGTVWTALMRRDAIPEDREAMNAQIERWLASRGVIVVARLGFENAYALAVRPPERGGPPVGRISELAVYAPRLRMAGDYEIFQRGEWRSLERRYRLSFAERRTMDPTLLYEALDAASVDVISAYTTDGRIAAYHLRVLEDDRRAIPPYDAVILASEAFARREPHVIEALRSLDGTIDADAMRRMNRAVDQEGRTPARVARAFVRAQR